MITKLYLCEYDTGERYENHYHCVIGVFSTQEFADQAGAVYLHNCRCSYNEGRENYYLTEIELDKSL